MFELWHLRANQEMAASMHAIVVSSKIKTIEGNLFNTVKQ